MADSQPRKTVNAGRAAPGRAASGRAASGRAASGRAASGRAASGRAPSTADTGLALYAQVKAHLERGIQLGHWQAGDRLPSESELVAQFGVARMTVNRALRELSDQGRIVRVAGVGSFVAEHKPQSTLLQIANLASEIRARGREYRCEVVAVERLSATLEVAAALSLRTGASVWHVRCVHLEDGLPVQLEERYVNPRLAPDFLLQDFTLTPPSEYLVRQVPLDEVEHVVEAVLPSPAQAGWLQMALDQPCLQLMRRTWWQGVPVTMVRCLHPADRYRLGSRFRPDGHPIVG